MHESVVDRGGRIGLARREYIDRERWKLFCCGHLIIRCIFVSDNLIHNVKTISLIFYFCLEVCCRWFACYQKNITHGDGWCVWE